MWLSPIAQHASHRPSRSTAHMTNEASSRTIRAGSALLLNGPLCDSACPIEKKRKDFACAGHIRSEDSKIKVHRTSRQE